MQNNIKRVSKFILILFSSVLFFQCTSDKKEDAVLKSTELRVEATKDLSEYRPIITKQLSKYKIVKSLNNISDYEITYVEKYSAYFMQGRGLNSEGNSVLFRQQIKLEKAADGSQVINFQFGPGEDPIGEECAGVNCSHCSFATAGGCDCNGGIDPNKPSGCNHTITRD